MTPTDPTQPSNATTARAVSAGFLRVVVYVVAAVALVAVAWALIEGGERDLWTRPSALELTNQLVHRAS